MLKTYTFTITILYTLALATICLVRVNEVVSKVAIPFGDKLFHFSTYVILTALWYSTFFYKFQKSKKKALWYAIIFCVIFGIIIEVLQGMVTTYRSSDINDVFANTTGVLLVAVVIGLKNKKHIIK